MPVYKKNSFRVDGLAMRYSSFVPRLFNFCLSLGMKPNRIMPSRAFCSDENQGYPFRYRRDTETIVDASSNINRNLIAAMPEILSSRHPALAVEQVNTQIEFDHTFRTIVKESAYRGKRVVFISGINIDVSPREGHPIYPGFRSLSKRTGAPLA
jgi:hypothetical protein